MSTKIEFLSAVLLISPDASRLATFYRDILGFPLEEEHHGETDVHYGCELGDVHFAIHPRENFEESGEVRPGTINLAFTVFDITEFVSRLEQAGVVPLYPPRNVGFAIMTALRDPDGNYLEFTQLAETWFRHLEKRREEGRDILQRWRGDKSGLTEADS